MKNLVARSGNLMPAKKIFGECLTALQFRSSTAGAEDPHSMGGKNIGNSRYQRRFRSNNSQVCPNRAGHFQVVGWCSSPARDTLSNGGNTWVSWAGENLVAFLSTAPSDGVLPAA